MLATEANRVAAAQSCIKQHVEPNTLPRAERPALLISGDMVLCPRPEPLALFTRRIRDAFGRIGLDVLRFERPSEKPTDRVEKIARLRRRRRTPFAAVDDRCSGDLSEGPISRLLQHVHEDVF